MTKKTYLKAVGLGVVGLLILTAAVRGEMRLGKPPAGQEKAVKQETSSVVQFLGILPAEVDGVKNLEVSIFEDQGQTRLIEEITYPAVQVTQGRYTLPLDIKKLELEVGRSYWVEVGVPEQNIKTQIQVTIEPQQGALAGGDERVLTGQYTITWDQPSFTVKAENTSTGYGVVAISSGGGVGLGAKTTTGPAALEAVHEGGGVAISAVGDVDIDGNLRADSIEYPSGSVDSEDIQDGTIVNDDISPTAGIAASKIAGGEGSGLDADLLDGNDSTKFAFLDNGNLRLGSDVETRGGRFLATQADIKNSIIIKNIVDGQAQMGTNAGVPLYMGTNLEDPLNPMPTQLVLASSGNVGIGTDTPSAELEVSAVGQASAIHIDADSNQESALYFLNAGSPKTALYRPFDSDDLRIWGDAGQNDIITFKNDGSGNVGIGMEEPWAKLDVNGDIQTNRRTIVTNGVNNLINQVFDGGNAVVAATAGASLYLGTEFDGSIPNQLVLRPNGNVGIGTTNPETKLHVGNGRGTVLYVTDSGPGDDGDTFHSTLESSGELHSQLYLEARAGTRPGALRVFYDSEDAVNQGWLGTIGDHNLGLGVNKATNLLIDTNGKVGMGTINPVARLHVNGDIGIPTSLDPALTGGMLRGVPYWESDPSIVPAAIEFRRDNNTYTGGEGRIIFRATAVPTALAPERMVIAGSGNVGIGTSDPDYLLHLGGANPILYMEDNDNDDFYFETNGGQLYINVKKQNGEVRNLGKFFDDHVEFVKVGAHYQDLAEWVPSSQNLEPAMVVAIDSENNNQVVASTQAYDSKVAGVVSAQPGFILGQGGEGQYQIAHTGRVKVRVDASYGAIAIGDLLVTSPVEGTAMKSQPIEIQGRKFHEPGTILGKALEALSEGQGEILVLLSLQ